MGNVESHINPLLFHWKSLPQRGSSIIINRMKKYIALFLLLSSNIYGQQKWRIGFKGAFEMRGVPSSFGISGDIKGTGSVPSFAIGLFAKRHIWRRFSFIAEPAFHDIGSCNFKELYSSLNQSQLILSDYTQIRYSAILIPIGMNYKVGLKTTLEIGVTPTFLIRGKQIQTIYNAFSKIAPNVVKEEALEKFYQEKIDFPIFLGLNYELNPKIELNLRIYGGNDSVSKVVKDDVNTPPEYTL
jgi:Outer membrane protein beta-barrel domain